MPSFSKLIMTFGSAFLLAASLSAIVYASNGYAKEFVFHNKDQVNSIHVYQEKSNNNRIYEVNGQKLYWKDFNLKQQLQIGEIETKIKMVEDRLHINEQKISPMLRQLDVKASVIENELNKLQLATIEVIEPEINLHDLEVMTRKLTVNLDINKGIVDAAQIDMQILQDKIRAIEFSFSNEIDQHVDELEKLLVAIAADFD